MEAPLIPDRRKSSDRRRAPRVPQSARVEIFFEDPAPVTVDAELVEASTTGFRVAHESKDLAPGLEVAYRHSNVSGRARVVWTHVLGSRRVSGFLML